MSAVKNIPGVSQVWSSIPADGVDVTAHDTNPLPFDTMGLWVGTGGDVRVRWASGNDMTFNNVANGTYLSGNFSRVYFTGTTASNIKAVH